MYTWASVVSLIYLTLSLYGALLICIFGLVLLLSYNLSCCFYGALLICTIGFVLLLSYKFILGISIGGGAHLCPCLYVVQIFDNTPAAKNGSLASGDEIVGVNGQSVKGRTKVEVARMIQSVKVSDQLF